MPTLYLMRHAKSDWSGPGLVDRERPLAPRGLRAAEAMGTHAAAVGIRPDLVLCSPALRTRQTLDLVRAGLGTPRIVIEDGLYGAGGDAVLELLRVVGGDAEAVMVVGHNPTMAELALWLTRGSGTEDAGHLRDRLAEKYPTGALATLAFDGGWAELATGGARLVGFVTPGDLEQ